MRSSLLYLQDCICALSYSGDKKKKKGLGFHENLILRNYRTFTLTQNIKCCRRPGHVALSFEFFFLLDINPKMTPFQHNYRRERKKRPFPPLSPASHLQWRDIKIDLNSTFLNTPSVSLWDFLSSLVTRYFFSLYFTLTEIAMVTPDSYCYCLDQNNTCACLLKQMVGLSHHLILHIKLWKEWKYHVDMWFNLSRWNIKYGYMAVHRTQVLHFSCVCV